MTTISNNWGDSIGPYILGYILIILGIYALILNKQTYSWIIALMLIGTGLSIITYVFADLIIGVKYES